MAREILGAREVDEVELALARRDGGRFGVASMLSVMIACDRDERSLSEVQPTARAAVPRARISCRCAADVASVRNVSLPSRKVAGGRPRFAFAALCSRSVIADWRAAAFISSIGRRRAPGALSSERRSRHVSLYSSTYLRRVGRASEI